MMCTPVWGEKVRKTSPPPAVGEQGRGCFSPAGHIPVRDHFQFWCGARCAWARRETARHQLVRGQAGAISARQVKPPSEGQAGAVSARQVEPSSPGGHQINTWTMALPSNPVCRNAGCGASRSRPTGSLRHRCIGP